MQQTCLDIENKVPDIKQSVPSNRPVPRCANTAFISKARQAHLPLCVTKSPSQWLRYRWVLFAERMQDKTASVWVRSPLSGHIGTGSSGTVIRKL